MDVAERTGRISDRVPRRSLWTDAFAVCNFLGIYRETGEDEYLSLARKLIDQVHHILGRHRSDDERFGWISGMEEEEGSEHPAAGGLRIGKPDPERGPEEPYDPRAEWNRDGQYFHYLTKWIHALDRIYRTTGEPVFSRWGAELAAAAYRGFTARDPEGTILRMYWKMSIDLRRPLVPSMGQHDPLDGLLTFCRLRGDSHAAGLTGPIVELSELCAKLDWSTVDPLGLGGLLADTYRAARLREEKVLPLPDLPKELADAARAGLERYLMTHPERLPATSRLAFRELGLVIGMEAAGRLRENKETTKIDRETEEALTAIERHEPWKEEVLSFWDDAGNQDNPAWREHRDINEVMLATALFPDGFL